MNLIKDALRDDCHIRASDRFPFDLSATIVRGNAQEILNVVDDGACDGRCAEQREPLIGVRLPNGRRVHGANVGVQALG